MKILCLADDVDPLVYSDHLKERFGDVDSILAAGDLSIDYYEYVLTTLNKPLYFVFGNHHLKMFNYFKNKNFNHWLSDVTRGYGSQCIDGQCVMMQGSGYPLLVAGLGGCKRYKKGESQYSEGQMLFFIIKMLPRLWLNYWRYGRYLDILLTHCPPYGLGDGEDRPHQGFKVFRWFLCTFKPKYMLYGHIHLYNSNENRLLTYQHTQLINCYGHYVLQF